MAKKKKRKLEVIYNYQVEYNGHEITGELNTKDWSISIESIVFGEPIDFADTFESGIWRSDSDYYEFQSVVREFCGVEDQYYKEMDEE